MPENNVNKGGEEEALSDLIANAIEKKRTATPEEYAPERVADKSGELSLSDSIAQVKYNKEHRAAVQSEASLSPDDNDDTSIEEMVANAMSMKARGALSTSEEHFVSESDIASDEDDAEYEEEEKGIKRIWNKITDFVTKHKLELMIAGLVLVTIAIIAIIAFIMIFNHYYNRIGKGDNSIILDSINDIDANDTVSDVNDYEEYLKNQLQSYGNIMGSEDVYNILLIGEDLRDTAESSRGNTDVMMLVSINNKTKKITLTSFMRDIYLYIPGYYSTRLNAAYATGGAELLKDTIEQNFGVEIDNYIIVNFYTFIDIIDTIGGVDVELTDNMVYAMRDPMREQNMYLGNSRDQDIPTTAGSYHLNGNQALGYVRIRHGVGDDFGRTARQREIIGKMIDKARGLSLLEMKELLDKITEGDNVRWDLEKEKVLQLLSNAYDYYKNYEVQELQIPADGKYTDQKIRGMAVLCPDFAANIELIQMTIYGETKIDPATTSTYYLPPSTSTTTREPYVVYTTTTTPPPYTTPEETDPPVTTTEEPQSITETTTPAPIEPPEVTTTPEETTTTTTTTSHTTTTASPPPTETTPVPQTTPEPTGSADAAA